MSSYSQMTSSQSRMTSFYTKSFPLTRYVNLKPNDVILPTKLYNKNITISLLIG